MADLLYSLVCPVCGEPPSMAMDVTQAFCSNGDCPAFSWNMTLTKEQNLDQVNFLDLKNLER